MVPLYSDEDYPLPVVHLLRPLGHDIITVREAGRSGKRVPDEEVLADAIRLKRAVLTINRWDFVRLHSEVAEHFGIVVCSKDDDFFALAFRVHQALANVLSLKNQLIRVNRPPR